MADEPQPEDKMTVRERRAAHAKQQARKEAPGKAARKAIVPILVILLLTGIAVGFYFENKSQSKCPGHFHGTFGIFIPNDNGTAPEQVDFATPIASNGGHYYDLQNRNSGMSLSVHMHQSGQERGESVHGPTQLHFEAPGSCVPLSEAYSALEVEVSGSRLELKGAHAQAGQDGEWRNDGDAKVHIWLETKKDGEYVWEERSVSSMSGRQLQDGEAFLLYYGDFTEEQVKNMQDSIPPPVSRV